MRTRDIAKRIGISIAAAVWIVIVCRTHVANERMIATGQFGGRSDVLAFQWLMRMPGAESRFTDFAEGAEPGGRLYGACGLYLIASDRYRWAIDRLSKDDAPVRFSYGCLGTSAKVRERVPDLEQDCERLRPEHSPGLRYELYRLTGL
jgi:hypothetical protein